MYKVADTYATLQMHVWIVQDMAIHVQDDEADWLVRDFARRRGVGITAAIKLAVREATAHEESSAEELMRRIAPLLAEVRQKMKPQKQSDKEFMDEGWGEND